MAVNVNSDINSKVYAVIKQEIKDLMKMSNEYFDIRHNDYLNDIFNNLSAKYGKSMHFRRKNHNDKNTFHLSRHHSGYEVHLRMKRSRMGQIAAVRAVGYYGFTTIGDVNVKNVEMSIFLLK